MLVLTLTHGDQRTLSRPVLEPICLQVADDDDPWMVHPDTESDALVLVNARNEVVARLARGDSMRHGEATISVDDAADDGHTDRIVAIRRRLPAMALSLMDGRMHKLVGRSLLIGSGPGADVVIHDTAVSASHCELRYAKGQWMVFDLGSTNGLWVGGARVPAAILTPGVQFTVGRTRIDCELDPARPEVSSSPLIGQAPCVRRLRAAIERFAPAPYSVLIEGESGSGKELVARDLHAKSTRSNGPMVCVNCGALAADVIESELFGHEKGAFTGAVSRRRGVFEEAHEGTLFLDEIGELPLSLQPKLLRVLETGELRKVGAERTTKVNVRVVSATLRDLEKLVQAGRFREDLFFRLSDFRLTVPPLRERRADIPALVEHLLARIAMDTGRHVIIEDRALSKLLTHSWPGNVRELLSTLKRAVYLAEGQRVGAEHIDLNVRSGHSILPPAWLPPAVGAPSSDPNEAPITEQPHEIPRDDLAAILAWCNGNLSRAAQMTGMPRSTIRYRLARPRSE